MSLPNKTTSDVELYNWCIRNVDGFVDVINRNDISKYLDRMEPGESLIINLDPGYKRGGSHWVALRISNESPYILYYKDSFGAPPPAEILNASEKIGRQLIYGNNIFQKINETNCGKRSAYFLRDIENAAKKRKELEFFKNMEM